MLYNVYKEQSQCLSVEKSALSRIMDVSEDKCFKLLLFSF